MQGLPTLVQHSMTYAAMPPQFPPFGKGGAEGIFLRPQQMKSPHPLCGQKTHAALRW